MLRLQIKLLLAVVVGLTLVVPFSASAQAQNDVFEVGAKIKEDPNLPVNSFAAVLLLSGSWPIATKVCEQYKRQYADSLNDQNRPYRKLVYFPKKRSYNRTDIDCPHWDTSFDQNFISKLDNDTRLSDRGEGPYLIILYRDANKKYHNKGYVVFADTNEEQIRSKFRRFNSYYHCASEQWEENRLIDDRSLLGTLMPRSCR